MLGRPALLIALSVAVLALAASAQAHVTIHPNALPAGAEATMFVNVPDESAHARTVKIDVKFPDGFAALLTEPVPGWSAKVLTKKLAKPITTDDGPIGYEVDQVIWTATGNGVAPGQFMRFPFSVAVPDKPGAVLRFKALQTYSNGRVVRWIGPAGPDTPAAEVLVASANSPLEDYPGGIAAAKKAQAAAKPRKTESHAPLHGAIAGLPLLMLAGAGLVFVRRRTARR